MIAISYESHGGGINNIVVATDWRTGEFSTSSISKEHAARALKRKMARRHKKEGAKAE